MSTQLAAAMARLSGLDLSQVQAAQQPVTGRAVDAPPRS